MPVASAADDGHSEPPFPPQLVEELLRSMGRATKTLSLYLPNNPIYQKAIDTLRAAFVPVWRQTTELVITVSEGDFKWEGRSVFHETNRSESLPWVFYKDGVRELTFVQGVEKDEIVQLMEIVQRVRKASPEEDDLLTLLWEQEFSFLRYRFVDLAFDAVASIEPSAQSAESRQLPLHEVRREVEEAPPEPEAKKRAGVVSMDDLDSTLYFLDEKEIEYLRTALAGDNHLDLHRDVLAIMLDIFEVQNDQKVREEVLGILESFMLHLLTSGYYGSVAYLLRETAVAAKRAPAITPFMVDRMRRLPAKLSDPTVLPQLLQSLDDSEKIPPQEELDALFGELNQGTLATVLTWLQQARNARLREALERAARRLAEANIGEMLKLIASDDPTVAREAIRRAGELKAQAAVSAMGKVLQTAGPDVRQVAATALAEIASPGAMKVLENARADADREVRITAARSIGAHGHRAALPRLELVVRGKVLKDADATEKKEYFEAYGALAGAAGIAPLDAILNGRTFLRRRMPSDVRACAAHALGKIGTDAALSALQRAEKDKDVRVRSAINKALRGAGM
jgi:HEAT repeat protein